VPHNFLALATIVDSLLNEVCSRMLIVALPGRTKVTKNPTAVGDCGKPTDHIDSPWWAEELSLQDPVRPHGRLHLEHFPSYVPELNSDEGVWSLARRALANGCPNDVEELVEDVIRSINRIRISSRKLRGCILQSGLPFLR
jgi:hypothetical protein